MTKQILTMIALSLTVSNFAHASGAVEYSCAGFQPSETSRGPLSKQSVIFNMISANNDMTIEVVRKSNENVDPANANLTVSGKDCKFTMDPDDQFPAYRVSVSGKCGTAIVQSFKGICFFDL